MLNTSSNFILEIACFDAESCIIAEQAGADRIEFCFDYAAGGITPTHKAILEVRKILKIPLYVIIRPRGGNFIYSVEEIEKMKRDMIFCKLNKIEGVVWGLLNTDQTVNIELNKELVALAKPMSVTFHRAIDECMDIEEAMIEIIGLGFDKVLTSGGKQNAEEGVATLSRLQKKFSDKIKIVPGGGIRSFNIEKLLAETTCTEFHSAAIINNKISAGEIKRLKDILYDV
jgi:copper homeostasis protein